MPIDQKVLEVSRLVRRTLTTDEIELVDALHRTMNRLMAGEHAHPGDPANDDCKLCRLLRDDGALIERLTGKRP